MTDDELQAMVREELFWDPKVDSAAIDFLGGRIGEDQGARRMRVPD